MARRRGSPHRVVHQGRASHDRLEVGAGYYLQHNLIAKASLQFNERAGGRVTYARLAAAQLLFWF